jgi:hypothetical protein
MIEIVNINQIHKGDIILISGTNENSTIIITVKKITNNGLIIPKEMNGLDICPEYMDNIVRIGTSKEQPWLTLLSESVILTLSHKWIEFLKNS